MKIYGIAQGTLFSAMWWRKYKKREDICTCITDSFCYTAETNTTL